MSLFASVAVGIIAVAFFVAWVVVLGFDPKNWKGGKKK